jgi:hypothetical protein
MGAGLIGVALQSCVLIFQPLSTDARRINVTAHARLPCLTWTIALSSGVRVGCHTIENDFPRNARVTASAASGEPASAAAASISNQQQIVSV